MMTVAQAMQKFISSLEIQHCEPDEKGERCRKCVSCNARRQRDNLRGHLEEKLAVSEFLISGSFKRRTALQPLNDVDLFIVLDAETESDLRDKAPRATLKKVQKILDEAYPTKDKPKEQSRSVNVEFIGTGISFDIVPAWPHATNGYEIPDRDAGAWIRTNPRVHAKHSTDANERANKKAKPIVKALKHWNGGHSKKLVRSFHLELMVYESLQDDPGSYTQGITTALRFLATRVLTPMPEPAGLGPNVDAGMTTQERQRASNAFSAAAELAESALKEADRGNTSEAHYCWHQLFGSRYPERGKAPKEHAPSIIIGSGAAPDPKSRRFG